MLLVIDNCWAGTPTEALAEQKLERRCFIGWPFVCEAYVTGISDRTVLYRMTQTGGKSTVAALPHAAEQAKEHASLAEDLESHMRSKLGIITGPIDVLLHVLLLKGMKRLDNGALVKDYGKRGEEIRYPIQLSLDRVQTEDARFVERPPPDLKMEYPVGSQVFYLGVPNYGCLATVDAVEKGMVSVNCAVPGYGSAQPTFGYEILAQRERALQYVKSSVVATQVLKISPLLLSRITSAFYLQFNNNRHNLGLNLKFEGKQERVLGYARKTPQGWEFSDKAIELLKAYKASFPEVFSMLSRNPSTGL